MTTVQEREMLVLGQAEVVSKLELARLIEFEAREAMVVNLMAAWIELIDNKMTRDCFEELLKRSEADMCRAIECLGRRDKIRKLEGALEQLESVLAMKALDPPDKILSFQKQLVERYLAEARAGN